MANNIGGSRQASFAAPTARSVVANSPYGFGRIWAPVRVNRQGPWSFQLDTCASSCVLSQPLVDRLRLQPIKTSSVDVVGVTGRLSTQLVRVATLECGDISLEDILCPVVPELRGGVDGIVGGTALLDKSIEIDFFNGMLRLRKSLRRPRARSAHTVPAYVNRGLMFIRGARVETVQVRAVLDTAAETSIGNACLGRALRQRFPHLPPTRPVEMLGHTAGSECGERFSGLTLSMGTIAVRPFSPVMADVSAFKMWNLADVPALMIGLDVLGWFAKLDIDFKRSSLSVTTNEAS